MKIRTALPLLYALSFLMIAATNGSAQLTPLYPYGVALSFDFPSITRDLNAITITPDTIRGSMKDASGGLGADGVIINIQTGTQWISSTKVDGNIVQDGSVINIGSNQTLPIEVILIPYGEVPDTESYCMNLSLSQSYQLNNQCISLALTSAKTAVRSDLPSPNVTIAPNPAGNYIFVRGLSEESAGYRYEIFSISGAEVRQGLLPADSHINIQDLSSGAYRLLLFDSKGMLSNTALTVLH